MILRLGSSPLAIQNKPTISTCCPHCGHNATFEHIVNTQDILATEGKIVGIRKCPNQECFGALFFVYNESTRSIMITYPSCTIPFDEENIPERVLNAFQEVISSHANSCFIASAIMIRKTLEEICSDMKAIGNNLYERLENLGEKIIIPKELKEGMQDLRLLGNDAAHIESNTFNDVGKEEVTISIAFTKEILKAVYQYKSLLEQLRSLKK
jgi:hypothetical protein